MIRHGVPKVLLYHWDRRPLWLEVVRDLAKRAVGFQTMGILERLQVAGFRMKSTDGREEVVAHKTLPGGVEWGEYKVLPDKIDAVAAASISAPLGEGQVYVIDEIGALALHSKEFRERLDRILASRDSLLATVAKDPADYVERLKALPGVTAHAVKADTRSRVAREVYQAFRLPLPSM
jgi:nucleoside-triphosphatase THEP1